MDLSQKSIKADSRSLNNLSGYLATSKQCTDRLPQSDLESDFGIGLFCIVLTLATAGSMFRVPISPM